MSKSTDTENGGGKDKGSQDQKPFALAFSGGGIRSASFQCGVLEQLKDFEKLSNISSLSTVSGGGYTGTAFLSHLMEKNGDLATEKSRADAFDNLEKKMKENINYLFGDNLVSQLHVIGAAFLSVPYTLLMTIAVSFITASMIYAPGPKIACTAPGNCTVVSGFSRHSIAYGVGFYNVVDDILKGNYTSSIFHLPNSYLIIAFIIALIPIIIIFVVSCFYFVHNRCICCGKFNGKDLVWNVVYWSVVLEVLIILIVVVIEVLKLATYLFGKHYMKEPDKGGFTYFSAGWSLLAELSLGSWFSFFLFAKTTVPWLPTVYITIILVGLIFPIFPLILTARICVWNIIENDSMFNFLAPWTSNPDQESLEIINLICWCVILCGILLHPIFSNLLRDLYQYRLKTNFYVKDWSLSEVKKTGIKYYASTTVSNVHTGKNRDYKHYAFSTEDNAKNNHHTLSTAMVLSGAAVSIRMGHIDRRFTSVIMRLILSLFNLNLGAWIKNETLTEANGTEANGTVSRVMSWCRTVVATILALFFALCIPILGIVRSSINLANSGPKPIFIVDMVIFGTILGIIILFLLSHFLIVVGNLVSDNRKGDNGSDDWSLKTYLNPYYLFHIFDYCSFFREIKLIFGLKQVEDSPYQFHSDGGHFDNLGLYALLNRPNDIIENKIYVFDAGADEELSLGSLYDALYFAERDGLIQRILGKDTPKSEDVDTLSKKFGAQTVFERSSSCCIKFDLKVYGKNNNNANNIKTVTVYYAKATTTGEEPGSLKLHMLNDPVFPYESTFNQHIGEAKFEAYKSLGYHIADKVFKISQQ